MYAEYVGLTPRAVMLIEHLRSSPDESISDILERVLAPAAADLDNDPTFLLDLGDGVTLRNGERLVLFLSDHATEANIPDAVAVVRRDGVFVDGERTTLTGESLLRGAMERVQRRLHHGCGGGELVSLNAWRQWYVVRYGRMVSLLEIKAASEAGDTLSAASASATTVAGLE